MGYCVSVVDSHFVIPAGLVDLAYVAACDLNHAASATKHGGSSTGEVWFSWVSSDYDETCKTLVEVMDHWRYTGSLNEDGDFVLAYFAGEKIGDEDQLFRALGPFVEAGSYIEYVGEDGEKWRFNFDGEKMIEMKASISWVPAT